MIQKGRGIGDFLNDILVDRVTTYEFSDASVSDENIKKILEAGRMSPSSHNSQPWKFIVIKDKKTIKKLMELCIYGLFYTEPPVLVAVVLDHVKDLLPGLKRGRAGELYDSHMYMNIGFCSANMINESQSLGIDSAILSPFVKEANKILHVPYGKEALLLLAFGYRKKGSYDKRKDRKALKDIVMYEKYVNTSHKVKK